MTSTVPITGGTMPALHVDDLALFGGTPSFADKRHVGRPNMGDKARFLARFDDIWESRWLSNHGPYVQAFEKQVTEILGVRHCIATSSGTMALEMAIRGLGLTGEVIVPSFTFIATAHALQWQGITPVFADVDDSQTLDPDRIESLITSRTSGILGVHLWGQPCAVEALDAIAKRHGLHLFFDASHAFGCSHHGQMIGHFGEAEVFSFHATKFVHALEGGAVVTNSDQLAANLRRLVNHGVGADGHVESVGTNGKMNEMAAAMGLTSFEQMTPLIAHNQTIYHAYRRHLADLPGVVLFPFDETERCNYQYVVLTIDPEVTGISRDRLVDLLQAENVLARRYFHPGCHAQEPYRTTDPDAVRHLPKTVQFAEQVMVLPTGTAMSEADVATIGRIIRLAVSHGREISRRWPTTAV
jgi:dTDP-4-amino-4,6-dideoxygalactose transaminase